MIDVTVAIAVDPTPCTAASLGLIRRPNPACRKSIPKGEPLVLVKVRPGNDGDENAEVCPACAPLVLDHQVEDLMAEIDRIQAFRKILPLPRRKNAR